MLTRCLILIGIISIMPAVLSCSGTTPTSEQTLLERNWGRSFEEAKYNQILNPDAQQNSAPVIGLDGAAARRNLKKYETSFEKEAPEPSYNISFGNTEGR